MASLTKVTENRRRHKREKALAKRQTTIRRVTAKAPTFAELVGEKAPAAKRA